MLRLAFSAGALALLGACASTDMGADAETAAMDQRAFFRCEGGGGFTAQFFGADRAVVTTSGGNRFDLKRAQGAPDYTDGTITFGTDMSSATLTGAPYSYNGCVREA